MGIYIVLLLADTIGEQIAAAETFSRILFPSLDVVDLRLAGKTPL